MTRSWWENEAVLECFRTWLAETGREIDTLDAAVAGEMPPEDPRDAPGEPMPEVGLRQLAEAFTAMRHELKLQTKSSRGLEDAVQSALQGLDTSIRQFQSTQAREREAAERAAVPLVEALVGLHEALLRGAAALRATHVQMTQTAPRHLGESLDEQFEQLPWWRRWFSRRWHNEVQRRCAEALARMNEDEFARLMEGHRLIQVRLDRALEELGICRIETAGCPVDPTRMTVVELVDDPQAEPETVVDEVRPGYAWHDKVIRFAEVRAVAALRKPETDSPPPEQQAPEDCSPGGDEANHDSGDEADHDTENDPY